MSPSRRLADLESERTDEASWCLDARPAADEGTELLARILGGLSTEPAEDPGPAEYWRQSAILNLTAMAVRAARGVLVLTYSGYAPEALGLLRLVSETVAYAQSFNDDSSGERARQWLTADRARRPRARALVQGAGAGELEAFDLYSQAVHADPRAAHRLHEPRVDQENRVAINIAPVHDVQFSNSVLAELTKACAELASEIDRAWEQQIEEAEEFKLLRTIVARHATAAELLSEGFNPYVDAGHTGEADTPVQGR
jgi:hypothetical protein